MAALAQPGGNSRMREQKANLVRGAFDGMSEQAGVFVNHLGGDASNSGSHHGLFLPESFGDGEAESFAKTFLDDDGGSALKSVHFQGSPRGKFQNLDIGISGRGVLNFFQDFRALRIIGSASSRKNQLTIEVAFDNAVGANDANRVLEAIEA